MYHFILNACNFAVGGPHICHSNPVKERPSVDHETDLTLLLYMISILILNYKNMHKFKLN